MQPLDTPALGTTIGPYVLEAELGRGGAAVVYRALDTQLQRRVALKFLRDEHSEHMRRRFLREAQAAARLRHPNLVTVHDAGEFDGRPFLVMELVDGRPLSLRGSLAEILPQFVKVARALDEVHRQGIVHRDLKPGNILVDDGGEPHVLDFGLAHLADSRERLTRTGTSIGTPLYMAPEQIAGRANSVGPATDVYALGAMLYELLAGRPPFDAPSTNELFSRILGEEPVPPPGPRDLATICLKALEKEPARRYATAGALADDLARHLAGEPVAARPPGTVRRVRRRLARHRLLAGLAGGALLGMGLAAWLLLPRLLEYSRREDLRALKDAIRDGRPYFYIRGADIRQKLARVERALEELEKQPARDAEIWATLGTGWYFAGDLVRAEAALKRAEELAPDDGRVAYTLGRICVERGLMTMSREGGQELSLDWFRRAAAYLGRPARDWPGEEAIDRHLARTYRALAEGRHDEFAGLCDEGLSRFGDVMGTEDYLVLRAALLPVSEKAAAYTRALERRPHYAWAYVVRAGARVTLGDAAGAAEDCTAALRINPRLAEAYLNRGGARTAAGEVDGALADFAAALQIDPGYPEAYYNRAVVRRDRGDHAPALADLDAAIRLNPRFAKAYTNRGAARAEAGDLAGALSDLDEAIRLQPSATAHSNRGLARQGAGRITEAIADFDEAIRLDAAHAEARFNRGKARSDAGDPDGALADYDEAIRLRPTYAEAYSNRGALRMSRGDAAGALADYGEAIGLNPRLPIPYYNRARLRQAMGRLDEAFEDYGAAIRLSPDMIAAWSNRATVRVLRGDMKGAIEDCTDALRRQPDYAEGYTNRAAAHAGRGDWKAARADLEQALRVAPHEWPHRSAVESRLAEVRRALGE